MQGFITSWTNNIPNNNIPIYIYRLCLTLYLLINISTDTIAHTSTKLKFWNSENCRYLLDFHLMKSSRF